ncbi:cytidylate kinase-like family protein [Ruminococcaceae bacterium OttesenSCG-928-O06]|nr:cytidylate kinase-like family protein [Ruminococcaceae bacterium OttesenSCG-928-O06]
MAENLVVCIARQFGSGGREVGQGLAETLGIAFYDKELLRAAAEKSGILQELFEKHDEKPTSGFMAAVPPMDGAGKAPSYADYVSYLPNDRMQSVIAEVIRETAAKGPCVIIGRCADYVLRGNDAMVSVFVHAALEARIQRVARKHNLDEDAARSLIRKTDRSRANYYAYYTDRDWASVDNYHLAVDSARLGIAGTVELLARSLELFR